MYTLSLLSSDIKLPLLNVVKFGVCAIPVSLNDGSSTPVGKKRATTKVLPDVVIPPIRILPRLSTALLPPSISSGIIPVTHNPPFPN